MQITIISSLPPIKGISPYTVNFLDALAKKVNLSFLGFNKIYPSFLYPGEIYNKKAEEYKNKNIIIKNVLNWYNPIQWIIEAFKIKTKIIHAQWWSFPLMPIYFTILGINKLRRKKIILTIHNVKPHEESLIINFFNRTIFFLGDEYIVHTEKNKNELKQIIKNKKIHVVPHGMIKPLLTNMDKKQARTKLNIDQDDKILLFFGHIREYKGLDTVLQSLKSLQNKNIKLLIAGECWEDWKKYEKIISDNNLKKNIILKLGFIPEEEIETIFKASDLLLLPYNKFNAQSGIGALALNFEIPMIVSEVGGLNNYIYSNNECLIKANDDQELAKKIDRILSNPDLYKKLQKNIIKKRKTLDWNSIIENVISIYTYTNIII